MFILSLGQIILTILLSASIGATMGFIICAVLSANEQNDK